MLEISEKLQIACVVVVVMVYAYLYIYCILTVFCVSKELNVGLASLLELPLQSLNNFICLVRLDLYMNLEKQMLHSWSFAAAATSVKLLSSVAISNESSIPDKEINVTLITNVFHSLVPLSMMDQHFVSSTGFPLHFEIGGTFGLNPYFCTLNV